MGVWLHKSVFSTEGLHHLSCKETDRKCCCGSHPARSELSPLGDGQAVGLKERLWNITQHASENHRLHLTKGHSSFHFSPLPLPLSLRVAPERAAGRTQVFWHPRAHSQHCLNIHWVKARSHPLDHNHYKRTRWLDSITDSRDMNLSKLRETVEDRGDWRAAVHGVAKSRTWLSNWTHTQIKRILKLEGKSNKWHTRKLP